NREDVTVTIPARELRIKDREVESSTFGEMIPVGREKWILSGDARIFVCVAFEGERVLGLCLIDELQHLIQGQELDRLGELCASRRTDQWHCSGFDEEHVQHQYIIGVYPVAAQEQLVWAGARVLVFVVVEDEVVDKREGIYSRMTRTSAGPVQDSEIGEIGWWRSESRQEIRLESQR